MPQVADFTAILADERWNMPLAAGTPTVVTYSFSSLAQAGRPSEQFEEVAAVSTFDAGQRAAARNAFEKIEKVSGLTFVEVPNTTPAMLMLHVVSGSEWAGWANSPSVSDYGLYPSAIVIDEGIGSFSSAWSMRTLLHEIGHAVGLKHPHAGDVTLTEAADRGDNTVMSYNHSSQETGELRHFDIAALRNLYGNSDDADDWSFRVLHDGLEMRGDDGADKMLGVMGRNVIFGQGGNDTIVGRENGDMLRGGAGHDELFGNYGKDALYGGTGDDRLVGGVDADRLFGGGGGDSLFGGDWRDRLSGGGGEDRLFGGDANDVLFGGSRGDRLSGGDGYDKLFGDAGDDNLFGGADDDRLSGGSGHDRLAGGGGSDRLSGEAGRDRLSGGGGYDRLEGGGGNDSLRGGGGDDTLIGGMGDDFLQGNGGRDRFVFDHGDDTAWGGSSPDTFVFRKTLTDATIRIGDFNLRQDALQFDGAPLAQAEVAVSDDGEGTVLVFDDTDLRVILQGIHLDDFQAAFP